MARSRVFYSTMRIISEEEWGQHREHAFLEGWLTSLIGLWFLLQPNQQLYYLCKFSKKANIYCRWCDGDSCSSATASVPIYFLETIQKLLYKIFQSFERGSDDIYNQDWKSGMEKTQLVSWRGKHWSCNWFILQPWCHCLLFAPFTQIWASIANLLL